MEEFSHHHFTTTSTSTPPAASPFIYFPSSSSSSSSSAHVQQPPPPPVPHPFYSFYNPNPNPNPNLKHEVTVAAAASSHSQIPYAAAATRLRFDDDVIKAKIISHPHYSSLLAAYMDCQKVGAPAEVVARLSAIEHEIEARQQAAAVRCSRDDVADPELDQFMEAYCNMLVKYREELTRPLHEAMEFLKRLESQFNSLTNAATTAASIFSSSPTDEKSERVGSSEEDQDGSGGEAEQAEQINPRAEDKELKNHLLKKYSGYLSSLRHELSKKKKKGKLPKEARLRLLNWWELHYKWPYPSEGEKVALAESTGLDQKQINNWFINQRKRHWKPSEDMQFVVMDAFHPQNAAAALYMGGHSHFIGDHGTTYRLGP